MNYAKAIVSLLAGASVALASSLVTSPVLPHDVTACTCAPAAAGNPISCACVLAGQITVSANSPGSCNIPGCIADTCKFGYSFDALLAAGCGMPNFYLNGGLAATPPGWTIDSGGVFHSGAMPFRLPCNSTGAASAGWPSSPACLEATFSCATCGT